MGAGFSVAMQRSADPARRFMMALSKVRLIKQLHDEDTALEYLDYVKKDFPEQIATNLPRLKEALSTAERLCCGGLED